MRRITTTLILTVLMLIPGACDRQQAESPKALVTSILVNGKAVSLSGTVNDVPLRGGLVIALTFTHEADISKAGGYSFSGGNLVPSSGADRTTVELRPDKEPEYFKRYTFSLSAGEYFGVNILKDVQFTMTTEYDPSDKFPRISDDELLTLVQKQTFDYFWSYGHPDSGLARERLGSDNTVTTGGSGFGVMTLPVAVERGFVSRSEAAQRLRKIVDFLGTKADRFHGAFPHWLNGTTGRVVPFSSNDNGGDLVETAFMIQGLLAAAQYFSEPGEADIRNGIDAIWRAVEWDWYTRGQDVLYWHWSPDKEWAMNMQVKGWNEGLIVYVLAASSPTHPVRAEVYHQGWASGGGMTLSNNSPMFFAHYSFMGLDPRGLKDSYADYWEHNTAHALRNYSYCVTNSKKHAGYSADSWGLTASDYPGGYTASSPSNDRGAIAPTAALASYPYVPEESLRALRQFYYVYGDRLWGKYGFYDAFCLDSRWFASSYIAIDQGPIIVMIENGRSGLLWRCFMKNPDILAGLAKLGFTRQ